MADQRSGIGFDVHTRDEDRPLLLAGVTFQGEPGLAGHSDADVVCHALADAILGAAAAGDVGDHFPERDAATAGLAGLDLLAGAVAIAGGQGWSPVHCDLTVIAWQPAISPRREEMRSRVAPVLGIPTEAVSIKATRPEGLGLSGDGIGCLALVTVSRT